MLQTHVTIEAKMLQAASVWPSIPAHTPYRTNLLTDRTAPKLLMRVVQSCRINVHPVQPQLLPLQLLAPNSPLEVQQTYFLNLTAARRLLTHPHQPLCYQNVPLALSPQAKGLTAAGAPMRTPTQPQLLLPLPLPLANAPPEIQRMYLEASSRSVSS